MIEQKKGLHDLGGGVWAWLAKEGGWGWSNAGLVEGGGRTLLIDTLFDLDLTAEMLAAMESITDRSPLTDAVNTHANGDHCYGNELLADSVRIHASPEVCREMHDAPPELLARLVKDELGPILTPFARKCFGPFNFQGIELRTPDVAVDGSSTIALGDRLVKVVDLGPAHTKGDVVVYVPDAGIVFAGDLLFIGGTPIMWEGPVENWISACDTMIGWDPGIVVPGHGPITTVAGILGVRNYFTHIREQARTSYAAGKDWKQAAWEIDLGDFSRLSEPERVVVTMHRIYKQLDGTTPDLDVSQMFMHMAEWDLDRGSHT